MVTVRIAKEFSAYMKKYSANKRPFKLIEPLEARLLFSASADLSLVDDPSDDLVNIEKLAASISLEDAFAIAPAGVQDGYLPIDDSVESDKNNPTRIVFIDSNVEDRETLLNELFGENEVNSESTLIVDILDGEDGIAIISQALAGLSGVQSVHVLSHGKAGTLQLGTAELTRNNVHNYEEHIAQWQDAFSADADILFYGCDVAATDDGKLLLDDIATLTQADVAASIDATGHSSQGGDWHLEYETGKIDADLVVSEASQQQWQHTLADTIYISTGEGYPQYSLTNTDQLGQEFTYNSGQGTYTVNEITVRLARYQTAEPQTVTLELRESWDGPILGTASLDSSEINDRGFSWETFSFADVELNDGQQYIIRVSSTGTDGEVLMQYSDNNVDGDTNNHMLINGGIPGAYAENWNLSFELGYSDETNVAPTVDNPIPDMRGIIDEPFEYFIPNDTFSDANTTDYLYYTIQEASGGSLEWLVFDPNTNRLYGTPRGHSSPTLDVEITAHDNHGLTVSEVFTIAVTNSREPTLDNPVADQNATEDDPFNFQFAANTFSDVDGDTLTYTASLTDGSPLPSWLSFDGATRTFSGTPLNDDVGTVSIQIQADDGGGTLVTDEFDLTVTNTNDHPTAANFIDHQYATEDSLYTFVVPENTFEDVDGDTLTYSAVQSLGAPLPAWLDFDPNTRTFSGTPSNSDVGDFAIELWVDDGNGGITGLLFDFTVINTNDAPTLDAPVADQIATEDSAFNFQFAANTFSDIDGDSLTYSAQLSGGGALPSWLNFDSATRTFSGTPLNADVGTIAIDIIADDGNGATATDTFSLNVQNTNDAPSVAAPIPDQTAFEDAGFNFQFASNTFADDDGDSLSYTAELAGGGALPNWLSFDAATRTFSGTPTNADVGQISVEVTASDGNGGQGSDTFTVTVTNTNDAPNLDNAVADQTATEDAPFNFQFAANTFSDIDGDTLTYSAQLAGGAPLPTWLSFDAATRTFSGTASNDDVGTINIEITADDGNGATATDTFSLTVQNTNDAPHIENSIPNQTANEDSAFNFQFASNSFADVDGDALTYTAQSSGGGALPSWLSFDTATRTFSGTPLNDDVGTHTIEVSASDGNGGVVTESFDITVVNTNDSPTVANFIDHQYATQDFLYTFVVPDNIFEDVDGDTLTYSAVQSLGAPLPAWLDFDPDTRTFSGTPGKIDVGDFAIELWVDDGNGGVTGILFDFTVTNTNDAPTLDAPVADQTATQDTAFSFQFSDTTFSDVDGDTLTYRAQLSDGSALPAWLSFDSATRTFSGTPTNDDVGQVTIELFADDGSGAFASDTFILNVYNVNDTPTLNNPLANQTANEDASFTYQIPANAFNDIDGDTLTYTAQLNGGGALPNWLTFDAATRTFSGIPANSDVGSISIQVTVDDGNGAQASDSFTLTVNNTNDAPTLANPIQDQSIDEDAAYSYQVPANTFSDVDGDSLSYTAELADGSALPAWLNFDALTRTFSGTPTNADVGSVSINIAVDDGNGGTSSDNFTLTINNTNDAPTYNNAIANQVATEDVAFNFQFAANTFGDIDGDTLHYSAMLANGQALPAWLNFDGETRTFSGTPTNGEVGTIEVRINANDGNGAQVNADFNIAVVNTNDSPILSNPISDQTTSEDAPFTYALPVNAFHDPDGDGLTYSATLADGTALPAWITFDAASQTFSGTPTNNDVGNIEILIRATDADSAFAEDTFALSVINTNDAPVALSPAADTTLVAGHAIAFDLNTIFTDVDQGDSLSFSVSQQDGSALPSWLTYDASTQQISGIPSSADVANVDLRFTATDNDGAISTNDFTITVVEAAPVTLTPINVVEDSPPQTLDLNQAFAGIAPHGEAMQFRITSMSAETLYAHTPSIDDNNQLALAFAGDRFGESQITIEAVSETGVVSFATLDVAVGAVNDAPFATPEPMTIVLDTLATTGSGDLATQFNDVEQGHALTYEIVSSPDETIASVVSFDPTTGEIVIRRESLDESTTSFTIRATDSEGAFVEKTITVSVAYQPLETDNNLGTSTPEPQPVTNTDDDSSNTADEEEEPTNTEPTPVVNETTPANNESETDDDAIEEPNEADSSDVIESDSVSEIAQDFEDPVLQALSSAPSTSNIFDYMQRHDDNASKTGDAQTADRGTLVVNAMGEEALASLPLTNMTEGFNTQFTQGNESYTFSQSVNDAKDELKERFLQQERKETVFSTVTLSVATGAVIWIMRASSLVIAMMSMMPFWRGVDPLPVVADIQGRKKAKESLEEDKNEEDRDSGEVGFLFDNAQRDKTNGKSS